jgi:uncharacterized protein (TIGR02246 family)
MADTKQQLIDFVDRWYAVFPSGDAAALAALYTPDARLMLANLPAVVGAEAIGAMLASFAAYADMKIRHHVSDVEEIAEGLAMVTGGGLVELTVRGTGATMQEASRFVMLMKRDNDGRWLCHYDVSQPTPDVRFPD